MKIKKGKSNKLCEHVYLNAVMEHCYETFWDY